MQWWCSAQDEPWTWAWQPFPGVWLFIALIAFAYFRIMRSAQAADPTLRAKPYVATFVPGLVLLWIALDWPVGAIGAGYLASVHMVQFLVMGMIAPPLMLYGIPETVFLRLSARALAVLRPITRPVVAFAAFNLMVVVTHMPPVVDTLMVSQAGSFLNDMLWLSGGLLFWWPVVVGTPGGSQLRELAKIGYLGFQIIAMKPMFVYLTFSRFPQYATFELAPRISGISARADQQIAGLLMEVGGMIIILIAVGVVFLKWYAKEESGVQRAVVPPATAPAAPAGRDG
jgi:putative membrane protein